MTLTLTPVRPGLRRQMLDFSECHCQCHCHCHSRSWGSPTFTLWAQRRVGIDALSCSCTEARFEGRHAWLDALSRHRASCTRSGRVKKRATSTESVEAHIFREAGATVRQNGFLRNMNVQAAHQDERRIAVLAQDLPCNGGAQVAADVTLRSALS